MEVITQFRKLLLAQVIMGILAFCIAGQSMGLMVVAVGLVALSWYLVEGPTGRALPNWVVVTGAGIAAAWLIVDLPRNRGAFVLGIGYFTMALQILLLFSKKTNREYAEILILSLMQMVGASVLDQSPIYGLLLASYCALAMFTVVCFQLKVTSDHVAARSREAMPVTATLTPRSPVVSRGNRWQFRGTTVALGLICALIGGVVFVLAPRDDGQRSSTSSLADSLRTRSTGFATEVDLTTPPDTSNDSQPVLHLTLTLNGRKMDGDRTIHLRGMALDAYDIAEAKWKRSVVAEAPKQWLGPTDDGVSLIQAPEHSPLIEGHVVLRTTTDNVLFTISPIIWIKGQHLNDVTFSPFDQRITAKRTTAGALEYDFRSLAGRSPSSFRTRTAGNSAASPDAANPTASSEEGSSAARSSEPAPSAANRTVLENGRDGYDLRGVNSPLRRGADYLRRWGIDGSKIRERTQEILAEAGLSRDVDTLSDPNDVQIAETLADYLRKHYTYSLTRTPIQDRADPITDFIFRDKEGHCELFAAALTAMTRSIGITSRMVSGYLATEYNQVGGYYVVRQANAHAWTEVYSRETGWNEVDPTPSGTGDFRPAPRARFAFLRQAYDHMEFAWVNSVVAYDQKTREAVLQQISAWGSATIKVMTDQFEKMAEVSRAIARSPGLEQWHLGLVVAAVLASLMAAGSLVQALAAKHHRLDALQLRNVPRGQRQILARRLGFYLQTMDLLERYGLMRPVWQTPMAYAEALVNTDRAHLEPLSELTAIFYEVRFGGRPVDPTIESRIAQYYKQLEEGLRRFKATRVARRGDAAKMRG